MVMLVNDRRDFFERLLQLIQNEKLEVVFPALRHKQYGSALCQNRPRRVSAPRRAQGATRQVDSRIIALSRRKTVDADVPTSSQP